MQLRCSQDAPSPSAAQHGASCAHFPPTRRAVRSPLPTRPHDPSVAIVRSWGRCGLPGSRAGCAMDEPSPVLPIFHYRYRVDMRLPSPNPAGPYCPQAPVPPDRVVSPPVAAAVACAALAQTASVLSPSAFALSLRAFRGVRYAPFPFRTRLPLWAHSPVQARRPTLLSQTLRRLRLRRRLRRHGRHPLLPSPSLSAIRRLQNTCSGSDPIHLMAQWQWPFPLLYHSSSCFVDVILLSGVSPQ